MPVIYWAGNVIIMTGCTTDAAGQMENLNTKEKDIVNEHFLQFLLCRENNKRLLAEKEETFVYVPIIQSLGQFLSNKKIAKHLIRHMIWINHCDEGIYYDICDGQLFKNDKLFKERPDALQIIIYHDCEEVCNPLGSHASQHKLDMYYYILGNFDPKVRSKHCAVRLLGISNSKMVKKYGYDAILRPTA